MQTEEQNHFFRARRVLAVILSMAVLLTLLCPLMARAEEPEKAGARTGRGAERKHREDHLPEQYVARHPDADERHYGLYDHRDEE